MKKVEKPAFFCILRWYKETGFRFREIEIIFEVPKKAISQNDVDQIKEIRITFFRQFILSNRAIAIGNSRGLG